jgi:hypothetical protein
MDLDNHEGNISPSTPAPLVDAGWFGIQIMKAFGGVLRARDEPLFEIY